MKYVSRTGTIYSIIPDGHLLRNGKIFNTQGVNLSYGGIVSEDQVGENPAIRIQDIKRIPFSEIHRHMPAHIVAISLQHLLKTYDLSQTSPIEDFLNNSNKLENMPFSMITTAIKKTMPNGDTILIYDC